MSDAQAVERRLNHGLLNQWYPVLPSWSLAGAPVGITRLSENLVLWRDGDGGCRNDDRRSGRR